MDPDKIKEFESAHGLPPASTSYPHPPGSGDPHAPIRYPAEPTAPPQEPSRDSKEVPPAPPPPPQPSAQESGQGGTYHGAPPPPPVTVGDPELNGAYGGIGAGAGNIQEKHPGATPGEQYTQHIGTTPQQQNPLQETQDGHQDTAENTNAPRRTVIKVEEKSLVEAYLLWFPLGIIGLHHFYLGRVGMGFLYLFTFGLFGIGWLTDLCRLPYLVREINEKRRMDAARGYILYAGQYSELTDRSVCTAYLFWLPPVGLLGGHHYYLGRIGYGLAYTLTLGLFGVGWFIDFCRMWVLTKRANEDIKTLRSGRTLSRNPANRMHLDDAYLLAFPLGFLGLHHFYMRRWGFGVVYFLTLGCMGIGFLVDLFRLPCLLNRTKRELSTGMRKYHLDDAYLLWFPLGVLGLHHFYLRRWVWGVAYFLTFGFFGIGWLVDLCRLPFLVRAANERNVEQLLPSQQHPPPAAPTGHPDSGGQYPYEDNTSTSQGAIYGSMPPTFPQNNMAVYAFPLDQHGHPVWTDGVAWNDDHQRETFQSQYQQVTQVPSEPPPPYSQY